MNNEFDASADIVPLRLFRRDEAEDYGDNDEGYPYAGPSFLEGIKEVILEDEPVRFVADCD